MAVMVPLMMVAVYVRVVSQRTCQQRRNCCVRAAAHAAIEPDSCLRKRCLCTSANAAADDGIDLTGRQETGQSSVTAAVCICDLFPYDLRSHYIVKLELSGMSKMLEYLSIFIRYCNSHIGFSLPF